MWTRPLIAAIAGVTANIAADAVVDLSLLARCGVAVLAAYATYGLLAWRARHVP